MNKPTRILFVVFAVFLFIHVGLSVAFSYEVYNTAAELRRQQTRDMLSLGARIEKAEALLQASKPESERDTCVVTPPCVSCQCSEVPCSCTKPEPTETDATATTYTLRTYRDIIGVFDGDGQLIRVLNVYCAALPEADREALELGIKVSSMDEVSRILEAYS